MPAGYSGESLLAPQAAGVANSAIQPLQGGAAAANPEDPRLVSTGAPTTEEQILPSQGEVDAALAAAEGQPEKQGVITKAATAAQKGALQQGLSPKEAAKAAVVAAGVTAADVERRTAREPRTKFKKGTKSSKKSGPIVAYRPNPVVTPPNPNPILKSTAPNVPVMLEYYALSAKAKYTLKGIQELMDAKRMRYARHDKAWKGELMKKWEMYENARMKSPLWKPIKTAKNNERAPIFATSQDRNSWQTGDHALLHLNPGTTPNTNDSTLVVIPPLRGNIPNLIKALESIPAKVVTSGNVPQIKIDPGVFIVFSYPYYAPALNTKDGSDNLGTNVLFLSVFLDLFLANPRQVAVLVKHEAEAFGVGLALEAYRSPRPRPGTPLVNFLEPSYVLYSISPLTSHTDIEAVCVTSAELKEEMNIPFTRPPGTPLASIPRLFRAQANAEAASAKEDRVLAVRGSTIDSKMPMGLSATLQTTECNALKSMRNATDIWNGIQGTDEPYIGLSLTITKGETGIDKADLFWLAFRFRYSVPHKPLCNDRDTPAEDEYAVPKDRFVLSFDAQTNNIPLFPVLGAGLRDEDPPRTYQIRIPDQRVAAGQSVGQQNRVAQDWISQKFTEDEALYLNSLGFSPEILEQAFIHRRDEVSWQYLLAEFLTDLVSTNCFLDTQMILDSRCERVRDFMETLNAYFIEENLTKEDVEKKQNEAIRLKLEQTREFMEREKTAQQAAAMNPPALEDGEFIDASKFQDGKVVWGTLWVYDVLGEATHMKGANVMVIEKGSGKHFFYSVRVPATQYEKDKNVFYKIIQTLRNRHPGYFFIY